MKITNEDNMELMARYDDNHFDLAIVDPPFGIGNFVIKLIGIIQSQQHHILKS